MELLDYGGYIQRGVKDFVFAANSVACLVSQQVLIQSIL
jgi:hypothetical protein